MLNKELDIRLDREYSSRMNILKIVQEIRSAGINSGDLANSAERNARKVLTQVYTAEKIKLEVKNG